MPGKKRTFRVILGLTFLLTTIAMILAGCSNRGEIESLKSRIQKLEKENKELKSKLSQESESKNRSAKSKIDNSKSSAPSPSIENGTYVIHYKAGKVGDSHIVLSLESVEVTDKNTKLNVSFRLPATAKADEWIPAQRNPMSSDNYAYLIDRNGKRYEVIDGTFPAETNYTWVSRTIHPGETVRGWILFARLDSNAEEFYLKYPRVEPIKDIVLAK